MFHHADQKAELALGPMRCDAATDRSVLASLSVAAQDLGAWVWREADVMEIDPLAMSCRLNERPAKVRGKLVWSGDAMRERVAQL